MGYEETRTARRTNLTTHMKEEEEGSPLCGCHP